MVKRITIFGLPGSGKTTFAIALSQKLNCPIFHIDKHYFQKGWAKRDSEAFLNDLECFIQRDSWIIEGNGTSSFDRRFQEADLIVYFKAPKLLCVYRIFKRYFLKDQKINDWAHGCENRITFGLLKYLWCYEKHIEKSLLTFEEKFPTKKIIQVRNKNDLRKLESFISSKRLYL